MNSPGKPCDETYRAVMELAKDPLYQTIVVAANWETIFADAQDSGNVAQMKADFSRLHDAGKSIVLLAMNPHSPVLSPQHLARPFRLALLTGAVLDPTATVWVPRDAVASDPQSLKRLAAFAADIGASVIDPYAYFCDAQRCIALDGGAPINSDAYHLSERAVRTHATFVDGLVGAPAIGGPVTAPESR